MRGGAIGRIMRDFAQGQREVRGEEAPNVRGLCHNRGGVLRWPTNKERHDKSSNAARRSNSERFFRSLLEAQRIGGWADWCLSSRDGKEEDPPQAPLERYRLRNRYLLPNRRLPEKKHNKPHKRHKDSIRGTRMT